MSHHPIFIEDSVLLDHILAVPPGAPLPSAPKRNSSPFARLKLANEMKEAQVSALFQEAINTNNLTPGLSFCLCEDRPDPVPDSKRGQRINTALLPTKDEPTGKQSHWADQLVPVQFICDEGSPDPFDDAKLTRERDIRLRERTRDQVASYAELTFHLQHRTFLLMLLVMGNKLRVMRWDRSGVVTTRTIDYVEDWKLVCHVLSRISLLAAHAPNRLGLDPTAIRILPEDPRWKIMNAVARKRDSDVDATERALDDGEPTEPFTFSYIRTLFRKSLKDNWPRYELQAPDDHAENGFRRLLVCCPSFRHTKMAGSGTSGYAAFDPITQRFTWLKDTWRADCAGGEREGDILSRLNAAKVRNVPTLVCHGDILDQATESSNFWQGALLKRSAPVSQTNQPSGSKRKREADPADLALDCPLLRHRHYRLVVEEVCMPLHKFTDGAQLLSIVHNCLVAHYDAWDLLHLIHGNISGGNILICPEIIVHEGKRMLVWKGILLDWKLARDPRVFEGRQPGSMGTWQFMSVNRLFKQAKLKAEVSDDLESFYYVILYYAVRYLRSNISDVAALIERLFDEYQSVDGAYVVGIGKLYAIEDKLGSRISFADFGNRLRFSSPLDRVLSAMHAVFHSLYEVEEYESRQAALRLQPPPTEKNSPPREPPTLPRRIAYRIDDSYDIAYDIAYADIIEAMESTASQVDTVPTEVDRTEAAKASRHKFFMALLGTYIPVQWPDIDNEGALIQSNWESICDSGSTPMASNPHESQKLQAPSSHSVLGVPLEGQPAVMTRKTVGKSSIRAPRVQRQGVRRSARLANKV